MQSVDFGLVLDRALDTAVAILFADLERSVFPSSERRGRVAGEARRSAPCATTLESGRAEGAAVCSS